MRRAGIAVLVISVIFRQVPDARGCRGNLRWKHYRLSKSANLGRGDDSAGYHERGLGKVSEVPIESSGWHATSGEESRGPPLRCRIWTVPINWHRDTLLVGPIAKRAGRKDRSKRGPEGRRGVSNRLCRCFAQILDNSGRVRQYHFRTQCEHHPVWKLSPVMEKTRLVMRILGLTINANKCGY